MATAHIGNRRPREGKVNPGRKHLAGRDVTAKMQRQYEHVLASLRDRFGSEGKRKQIAAATVRKLAQNPGMLERWIRNLSGNGAAQAEQLAEEFHGRPPRDVIDVEETETYDDNGAALGYLVELNILTEDGDSEIPIRFRYSPRRGDGPQDDNNNVLVVSNPSGTNIEFVGGDQKINWRSVDGAHIDDKNLVIVGPVHEIVYWADKHHLSGPQSQKNGMEYYHEFGEEDGELPVLVYDRRNAKLLLVGGNYTIEPEGITG